MSPSDQRSDLELQSAYKKHHSTESALLKGKNDILLNTDAQKVTLLVLLDLLLILYAATSCWIG